MSVSRPIFEKYLALGLSVFPVHFVVEDNGKIGKRPSVRWKEFMTRRATAADLDAWFALREPEGIGLATGEISGVVAVDVDTKDTPIILNSSVVSQSAFSGGHHFLYKWSEEVRNTVRIEGMPIDFRGDGGYIVLPPSEYQGKMYIWETQDFDQLQPLPLEIKKMLTERKQNVTEKTFTGNQFDPFPDAGEGERNDKATRVAGLIIGKVSYDMWQSIGWMSLLHWNSQQCHPPLDEVELRTVFDSVITMESRKIVKENKEVLDIPMPTSMAEVAQKRLEERELEKYAPSTGYKDLDKYIKGFIPGHVYTMTGDTNVGKTTVCCNFADRVSKQGKKVLYFALEPENTLVDYLASIRTRKRFDQLSDVDLLEPDTNISVYGKEQIQRVEDLVKVVDALPRYDFIVIDHIGYFTTDGKDMNSKQSNVMKTLAALAKAKQCAIMIVAHIRKRVNNKAVIHEDDISGSAAFKQDATEVMIISRKQEPDNDGNLVYTDDGIISIRKTKTGGGQGSFDIHFKPGTALILDSTDLLQEMWK
jgi:KaiC/GvpD/RAD55 family RecA-like ATPase